MQGWSFIQRFKNDIGKIFYSCSCAKGSQGSHDKESTKMYLCCVQLVMNHIGQYLNLEVKFSIKANSKTTWTTISVV